MRVGQAARVYVVVGCASLALMRAALLGYGLRSPILCSRARDEQRLRGAVSATRPACASMRRWRHLLGVLLHFAPSSSAISFGQIVNRLNELCNRRRQRPPPTAASGAIARIPRRPVPRSEVAAWNLSCSSVRTRALLEVVFLSLRDPDPQAVRAAAAPWRRHERSVDVERALFVVLPIILEVVLDLDEVKTHAEEQHHFFADGTAGEAGDEQHEDVIIERLAAGGAARTAQ